MKSPEEIRHRVSKTYTRAVVAGGGCCGGSGAGGETPTPKGVAAKCAGYDAAELSAVPEDAVVNSFGCGNPLAFSDVAPGETVLDLGSGAGIDLLLAARKVGPAGRVIGVDMTDEMIARARRSAADAGYTNAEVRKGLIEDLPVEDASVDLVISNCVINLSPEKGRVFAEIARVLKPGGRMQVSDIVVESLPRWVRWSSGLYDSCVGGAISESAYVAGLARAGLEDVEVVERLVYDGGQLAALAISEMPGALHRVPGLGRIADAVTRRLARSLEGKIWSIRVRARKAEAVPVPAAADAIAASVSAATA